jgi:coenzyme F420 hydrogenase subunit beta
MKTAKISGYTRAESIGLVIGLFCGWTLSMEKFQNLLKKYHLSPEALTGMDIPAGKNILELQIPQGRAGIPMAEVDACVRTACRYCIDSTAEFADLSVGAARYGGDCDEMRGWNQIIVRSASGRGLIELAQKKGVLEVREAPASALQALKNAAAEKKRKALKNIVEKSRSVKKLLYLNSDDPVVKKYLK